MSLSYFPVVCHADLVEIQRAEKERSDVNGRDRPPPPPNNNNEPLFGGCSLWVGVGKGGGGRGSNIFHIQNELNVPSPPVEAANFNVYF
jgi:hypothetical protein